MAGTGCPWPFAEVFGGDFFQHVRSIQMWNFKPDSVACAADLPFLEEVHIKEDEVFKNGELTADSFRSLRGHRRIYDLYIDAPFDDEILSHFTAPRLQRLVLTETRIMGSGLRHIRPDRLETLTLYRMPIDDAGMQNVTRFGRLRKLLIQGTDVTDNGLQHLRSLSQLETLVLIDLEITGDGLRYLPRNLRRLYLRQVPISDAAIKHLAGMQLERLHLLHTNITPAGIESLRQLLPDCTYQLVPNQGVQPTPPRSSYDTVFLSHPGAALDAFDNRWGNN